MNFTSSLLDQVASGILILDASGSVRDANTAARNLLAGSAATTDPARNDASSQAPWLGALHLAPSLLGDLPDRSGTSSATNALLRAPQGSTRRSNTPAQPKQIGTLAQRVLQSGEAFTRTGYLFAPPTTRQDASVSDAPHIGVSGDRSRRGEALTAEIPADAPFVRLTLRPSPAADRVVVTIEPLPPERLPLPPSAVRLGAQDSQSQDSQSQDSQVQLSQPRPLSVSPFEVEPLETEPLESQGLEIEPPPSYVRILEAITQGESAESIATSVSALLEERTEGLTAVVMRYNAATRTLHHLTSPSLSDTSRAKLRNGLPIRECALCRTAVEEHARQRHDLTDDAWLEVINPAWHHAFDHAKARTCWTVPIMRDASNVLGVIVLLFETPQLCAVTDPALIDTSAYLIHIALERDVQADDLREHTERLRQMTETMHEVFWLRTVDQVLHISDSFEDVWGRPVEDLYADPDIYLEDVHPDDLDRVSAICDELLYDRKPVAMDYRVIRRSDGETRWVRVHFRPVDNPTGAPRFAGTIRDITEEITSQKQLEMSEQTYRNLIDHATDAIYVQNVHGEFVDLSEGVVHMYGYTREELLGKTPAFVSAPGKNDLDRVDAFFADALDGRTRQFEFWGQRADGSIFPKEVRLQKATFFGEPVVVAFALDISTRVAAEEALRKSEQRYRLVVKNMKDMVMLHDAEGGTLWVSPSVKDVTGRTPETAVQLGAFDVIHPDDQERVAHHLAKLHEGVNLEPIIYRIRHNNGHYIWVETLVQGLYAEDGTLERIQSASRDVTERKRQQEELRKAKRNAEDADRLKSAMLANMSHEIRTPLTSIIGFSEVLQEEGDPTYQRFAGLIYNSSRRLMQTLDSVLQLSKLEAGLVDIEVEPVNLKEELLETLDLLRLQAEEKDIHLSVEDVDNVAITGTWDGSAMHRILTNLVGNAIKFTGDGGSVRLSAEERANRVYIRVADNGVGIAPEFMPHIFEPFKQETGGMRRSYEGTGLGLAIVQRLVEMMGGTIDVESKKGEGTTFTVILPTESRVMSSSSVRKTA